MVEKCGCKPYCESCSRDEIEVDEDGFEFCNECSADGWGGELCWPMPCSSSHDEASDEHERSFMCPMHAEEHEKFCQAIYEGEKR